MMTSYILDDAVHDVLFDEKIRRRLLEEDEKDKSLDVGPNGKMLFMDVKKITYLSRKDAITYIKFSPLRYVQGDLKQITDTDFEGIKELKTDSDVQDFVRVRYENKWFVDLYVEHFDYDVMDFINEEANGVLSGGSSDEYYSNDEIEEFDDVDFHTQWEENVVIKNLTTHDLFLNKLCVNNEMFRDYLDESVLETEGEALDNPDDAHIDPIHKAQKGVLKAVGVLVSITTKIKKIKKSLLPDEDAASSKSAKFAPKSSKKGVKSTKSAGKSTKSAVEEIFYAKVDDLKYINLEAYEYMRLVAMNKLAVPTVRKRLEYIKPEQRNRYVFPSAYEELEVRCEDQAYVVNLCLKTCSCRLWQLSGVPCTHAVAGYMHLNRDPGEGVHFSYSQEVWARTYQYFIRPVPGGMGSGIGAMGTDSDGRGGRSGGKATMGGARGRRGGAIGRRGGARGRRYSGRGGRRGDRKGSTSGLKLMDEDDIKQSMEDEYIIDLERKKEEQQWKAMLDPLNDYIFPDQEEFMDVEMYNRTKASISFMVKTQESVTHGKPSSVKAASVQPAQSELAFAEGLSVQPAPFILVSDTAAKKKEKRTRSEPDVPFRIYHKNIGRSERIRNMQEKKV
nr:splicing factor [Tanacetum cinerariifolium]